MPFFFLEENTLESSWFNLVIGCGVKRWMSVVVRNVKKDVDWIFDVCYSNIAAKNSLLTVLNCGSSPDSIYYGIHFWFSRPHFVSKLLSITTQLHKRQTYSVELISLLTHTEHWRSDVCGICIDKGLYFHTPVCVKTDVSAECLWCHSCLVHLEFGQNETVYSSLLYFKVGVVQ